VTEQSRPQIGGGAVPLSVGELGPNLMQCRLGRGLPPYPSGILILPAVWPQQTWAENWRPGCSVPFRGGVRFPSNTIAWAEAYLRTNWHLDPSNRLATRPTIHQRYRHNRQDIGAVGRTVTCNGRPKIDRLYLLKITKSEQPLRRPTVA